MMYQVVLKLGGGNWQQGCPTVTAQLWAADRSISSQFVGSLPAAPELLELYERWRSFYGALNDRISPYRTATIEIAETGITNVSRTEFDQLCQQLKYQFNLWLETRSFNRIEQQLRTKFLPSQSIQVIVETDDPLLRRFPWQLWTFLEDYPLAEVALSVPEYQRPAAHPPSSPSVRLLAVLGDSQGIDVQFDRSLLQQLPQAEIVFLVQPERPELNRWLWDEQGWDILFFAGHSSSQMDATTGEIAINPTDRLTIEQLRNALKAGISRGIKLAIFNSCDGVGLARSLAALNIPQLIVMREPVPDRIAQEFLQQFLFAFAHGKSLYLSVREAREKLQSWEQQFPCASWLPVICQNPAEVPIEWSALVAETQDTERGRERERERKSKREGERGKEGRCLPLPKRQGLKIAGMTSLLIASLVMGIRCLGMLQSWELSAFDHLMRLRPPEGIDPRILVVEVTQKDIAQYGYPLQDATLAQLIATLERSQPRAIGLDMHRAQPRGQGRSALIAQFQQHQNLFIVCSFAAVDQNAPPPEFSATQRHNQVGFSDLIVEGINLGSGMRDDLLSQQSGEQGHRVRRQLLSYDPTLATTASPCTTPYSFSLQLAFRWLSQAGIQPIAVSAEQNWQIGAVVFQKLPTRFAAYQQLDGWSNQILIHYRTDPPGARVTLEQVLQGQVDRSLIEHRIVLIGTTAAAAKDSFDTLYGEMPGVWLHAHMLSQLLSAVIDDRPLIWALPQWRGLQWADLLWVLSWAGVGGVLGWRLRSDLGLGLALALVTIALHQLCLMLLIQGGWMPLIPPLLALWATSLVVHVVITSTNRRQE